MSPALDIVAHGLVAPAVHIGVYDGPLDLLLFLVKREGVDVRAIPVARICDVYLSAVREAEFVDVDEAGDYLLLAATLCQLKARELLPRQERAEADVEEEDPKERLQRRLIEYDRYRQAADALAEMPRLGRETFCRPEAEVSPEEVPLAASTDSFGLLRLYYQLVEAKAAPAPIHQVAREPLRLADSVRRILETLSDNAEHTLGELLAVDPTRAHQVFTFVACLEMARRQMIDLRQLVHLGVVRIRALVSADRVDADAIEAEA